MGTTKKSRAYDHWHFRDKNGRVNPDNPFDYYPTPAWVTEALLEKEKFKCEILEPASGDGSMATVIRAHGYWVDEADIRRGQDFLDRKDWCWNIVTNPPYGKRMAEAFVRHALKLAFFKVAMLLPMYFIEAVCRNDIFTNPKCPVKSMYFFSRRIKFGDNGHASPFGTVCNQCGERLIVRKTSWTEHPLVYTGTDAHAGDEVIGSADREEIWCPHCEEPVPGSLAELPQMIEDEDVLYRVPIQHDPTS
jgi:hypothetical protein